MRLHFKLTPNNQIVPFDYQHYLTGVFHKWLEKNNLHDKISLYSLSWLQGSKLAKGGFNFPDGASWFISFWDEEIGKQIIKNALDDPEVCCGMAVYEIYIQENPTFTSKERFLTSTPVHVRKYDENRNAIHLTVDDNDTDFYMTETLKRKMTEAGLNFSANVSFDKTYPRPKTKLVNIKGVKIKANFCPVILEGDPEAIQFAWNVGVGHLTGSGFGALS